MKHYILKKILILFFLIITANTMIFFIIRLVPGDPADIITANLSNRESLEITKKMLNIDKPILKQYCEFIANSVNFNLGNSYIYKTPVEKVILKYLPNTLLLAVGAMFFTVLISILLSVLAFIKPDGLIDLFVTVGSASFLAIPNFLLGPLLILIFSYYLKVLPASGSGEIRNLVLPILTLSLSMSAYLTKVFRTSFYVEKEKSYVEFARTKGLSEFQILYKHIFKNAMIPIFTVAGLQFGALISGVIITENIFAWQGIGTILITAIKNRDYPLVQGITIFILLMYLLINFLIDLSYFFIDPQIRKNGDFVEHSY